MFPLRLGDLRPSRSRSVAFPTSEKLEDHFTTHCCRHWFTTHLMRAGMPREHVQELRGDVRPDAIDIYYHIDPEELRKSYLAHVPRLDL